MKKRQDKINISIKHLERIAKHYEFPLIAFFVSAKTLRGTRRGYLQTQWNKKFKKINALVTDLSEEIKGVI